jgi:integrase/recombinase XerD
LQNKIRVGSLYTTAGQRKYLTAAERTRFLNAARSCPRPDLRALCLTLAYTGCRISEALALTPRSVEREGGFIALRSLKRRKHIVVIREIPVPTDLFDALNEMSASEDPHGLLWPLSRTRAWQLVKNVMREAAVAAGPHMTPERFAAQLRNSRDTVRRAAQPGAALARSRQYDHHRNLFGCIGRGRTRNRGAHVGDARSTTTYPSYFMDALASSESP